MSQISGRDLELVQWHFHTPSEHAFDGARKAMEAHLVHKDTKTGGVAHWCHSIPHVQANFVLHLVACGSRCMLHG